MPAELEIDGDYRRQSPARQWQVAEMAARQHGVIARRQLIRIGYGVHAIDHAVRRGALHVIYRGAYAVGHRRLSRRGRWMAAVLSGGPGSVLSHRSAAALWRIDRAPDAVAEVLVGVDRPRRPGILVRRASLADADRAVIDGIPVTSLPRTLLDLAATRPDRLEQALEKSERLELFDLRAVDELTRRSAGRRGMARLRAAIALYREDGITRSELERRFREAVRQADLPPPALNAFVAGYEVDALWRREKLIVELDGYEFHRSRQAFERDRIRDDELELAGFKVIRLTWSRLSASGLGDRLWAHLAQRRRELRLAD